MWQPQTLLSVPGGEAAHSPAKARDGSHIRNARARLRTRPRGGLLHETGYLVFGSVVDDDGVTGEGCVGSVAGGAGAGAGLDLDFRMRFLRALPMAST